MISNDHSAVVLYVQRLQKMFRVFPRIDEWKHQVQWQKCFWAIFKGTIV